MIEKQTIVIAEFCNGYRFGIGSPEIGNLSIAETGNGSVSILVDTKDGLTKSVFVQTDRRDRLTTEGNGNTRLEFKEWNFAEAFILGFSVGSQKSRDTEYSRWITVFEICWSSLASASSYLVNNNSRLDSLLRSMT